MQSEQINELAGALAKAQGEIKGAAKDSTNPHFKSRYADLASVWDACRAPLSKHGLAVVQTTEPADGCVRVVTTLAHSSGQWMSGTLIVTPQQNTPQGMGSAITYCRRYALAAMVGVAPDDDDDGNAASQRNGNGQPRPDPSPPIPAAKPPAAATNGNGKTEYVLMGPNGKAADRFPRPGAFLEALDKQMEEGDDPQAWWEPNKLLAMKISGEYPTASRALIEHMLQRVEDYGREMQA